MKIFPFNKYLQAPEDDNGNGNGGGGSQSGGQPPATDVDDSNSPEDSGVSSSDIDFYNTHQRRIGGRTTDGKVKEGTLQKALEKTEKGAGNGNQEPKDAKEEDSNKDSKWNSDGTKKETDENTRQKESDNKEADNKTGGEEEDILNLDPASLRSKSGAPITNEAQANFNKIKDFAKKYKSEVAELKTKLEKAQSTESSAPEVEAMKKELDELRSRVDIEQFESSEGFIQTYEKPMIDAKNAVAKFFPSSMEEDDVVKLTAAFKQAHDSAIKGNEVEFYRIVDDISDNLVDGGQSLKNAFAGKMEKYYEKLIAWAEAKTNKGEDRKKFVERNMQEVRGRNTKGVEASVEDYIRKVMADKAELLDGIDETQRTKYVKSIEDNRAVVKNHLAKMTVTGEVSSELAAIIQKGIVADSLGQENAILAQGYIDAGRRIKQLEEKVAKFEQARKGNSNRPDSNKYPARDSQSTERNPSDRKPGEGAISYNLRKAAEAAA